MLGIRLFHVVHPLVFQLFQKYIECKADDCYQAPLPYTLGVNFSLTHAKEFALVQVMAVLLLVLIQLSAQQNQDLW